MIRVSRNSHIFAHSILKSTTNKRWKFSNDPMILFNFNQTWEKMFTEHCLNWNFSSNVTLHICLKSFRIALARFHKRYQIITVSMFTPTIMDKIFQTKWRNQGKYLLWGNFWPLSPKFFLVIRWSKFVFEIFQTFPSFLNLYVLCHSIYYEPL